MRDLFLDFGTFTVRIVETMPGEPGEEADGQLDDSYDVITTGEPWPGYATSDLGQYHATGHLPQTVEVVDADTLPTTDEREADRRAILRQELVARAETAKARLGGPRANGRYCRHHFITPGGDVCGQPYYFNFQTEVFEHNGGIDHAVKPTAEDAEELIIYSSLLDMLNDL